MLLNNIYASVSKSQSSSDPCLAAAAALWPPSSWTSTTKAGKPHLFSAFSWGPSLSCAPLLEQHGGGGTTHTDAGPLFSFFLSLQFKWTFPFPPHIQVGHHLESVIYLMVVLTPLRNSLLS